MQSPRIALALGHISHWLNVLLLPLSIADGADLGLSRQMTSHLTQAVGVRANCSWPTYVPDYSQYADKSASPHARSNYTLVELGDMYEITCWLDVQTWDILNKTDLEAKSEETRLSVPPSCKFFRQLVENGGCRRPMKYRGWPWMEIFPRGWTPRKPRSLAICRRRFLIWGPDARVGRRLKRTRRQPPNHVLRDDLVEVTGCPEENSENLT